MHHILVFVFFQTLSVQASEIKTEAKPFCLECQKDELNHLKITAEKIESELKNKINICDSKGLINTKRQAQINKWIKSENEDPHVLDYLFRQTASCIYGLGEGAIFAVGSLVKGIADLTSGAYNGGKDLVQYFKDKNASELIKNLDLKRISENIIITTGNSVHSITNSISKMSASVKKTYQDIGFQGTLSLIGYEMWQKSPHQVIKKFLKKAVDDVGQYLTKESQRFNCLDNESKAELMCKLISSVATDVAVGTGISKLILFGKSAIGASKAKLINSTSKLKVDEQLTHAAEMLTQRLSPSDVTQIVNQYKISSTLNQSSVNLLMRINSRDQQSMLKLLDTVHNSKINPGTQLDELFNSLSKLPQETLDRIDVATIINESEHALSMGNSKIIKEWAKIVKTDFKNGRLGCYSKSLIQK